MLEYNGEALIKAASWSSERRRLVGDARRPPVALHLRLPRRAHRRPRLLLRHGTVGGFRLQPLAGLADAGSGAELPAPGRPHRPVQDRRRERGARAGATGFAELRPARARGLLARGGRAIHLLRADQLQRPRRRRVRQALRDRRAGTLARATAAGRPRRLRLRRAGPRSHLRPDRRRLSGDGSHHRQLFRHRPGLPPHGRLRLLRLVRRQPACGRFRADDWRLPPALQQAPVVSGRAAPRLQLAGQRPAHDQGRRLFRAYPFVRDGRRLARHAVPLRQPRGMVHRLRRLPDSVEALLLHDPDRR